MQQGLFQEPLDEGVHFRLAFIVAPQEPGDIRQRYAILLGFLPVGQTVYQQLYAVKAGVATLLLGQLVHGYHYPVLHEPCDELLIDDHTSDNSESVVH